MKNNVQMSESFITGALLAVAGGYFDAYTYIARGGVFANAQTGNIVLCGINLAEGNYLRMLSYMIPVIAFILGIFTAETIKRTESRFGLHWRQKVILLEMLGVIAVGLLPVSEKNLYTYNMTANVLISFICSLQVQSFRRVGGIICATTMCTGNLRSGTESLLLYHRTGDRKKLHEGLQYYLIILLFVSGAFISVFITRLFWGASVIFTLIPLLTVWFMMFTHPKKP